METASAASWSRKTMYRASVALWQISSRWRKTYEIAIETALGGSIQNIVTDNEQTAKEMIEFLKKNRYGRATFLPLTSISQRGDSLSGDALKRNRSDRSCKMLW